MGRVEDDPSDDECRHEQDGTANKAKLASKPANFFMKPRGWGSPIWAPFEYGKAGRGTNKYTNKKRMWQFSKKCSDVLGSF